tara:strand:+ start:350 stop:523 length:174 start_codon:yes stop_codon:yes gene_type:complete
VGIIALHGFDRSDLALFIKQDPGFLRVKIKCTTLIPRAAQYVVKPVEPFDLPSKESK